MASDGNIIVTDEQVSHSMQTTYRDSEEMGGSGPQMEINPAFENPNFDTSAPQHYSFPFIPRSVTITLMPYNEEIHSSETKRMHHERYTRILRAERNFGSSLYNSKVLNRKAKSEINPYQRSTKLTF